MTNDEIVRIFKLLDYFVLTIIIANSFYHSLLLIFVDPYYILRNIYNVIIACSCYHLQPLIFVDSYYILRNIYNMKYNFIEFKMRINPHVIQHHISFLTLTCTKHSIRLNTIHIYKKIDEPIQSKTKRSSYY